MVKCLSEVTGQMEDATILPGYIGYDGTVVYEPMADIDLCLIVPLEFTATGETVDERSLRRTINAARALSAVLERQERKLSREERIEQHMLRIEREMLEQTEEPDEDE